MIFKGGTNMDSKNNKPTLSEKFKYHAYKALDALKKGDRETYLSNLKIASGILKEIKQEKKQEKPKR